MSKELVEAQNEFRNMKSTVLNEFTNASIASHKDSNVSPTTESVNAVWKDRVKDLANKKKRCANLLSY